jgi:hypothetical protein
VNRFRQRQIEAAQRSAERREREANAPRLVAEIPSLESLRLEVQEYRAGGPLPESAHVRRITLPSAPALFDMPCLDSTCTGGGHDVTNEVLRALRSKAGKFEGENACLGTTGATECRRVLHYTGIATYR